MGSTFGGIDLNLVQMDVHSDDVQMEDDGNVEVPILAQEDNQEVLKKSESFDAVSVKEENRLKKSEQEEPEEGEISDNDDGHGVSNVENDGTDNMEGDDVAASVSMSEKASPVSEKTSLATSNYIPSSYGSRWINRSNSDSRHDAWTLRSEASAYSSQPDKFYQFAWAKGVQECQNDSLGDPLQDERYGKARRIGESGSNFHRTASVDRNSGWIFVDRGIEYASSLRSDGGYFFLQDGDRSEQRRGDARRERTGGGCERLGKNMFDTPGRDYRNNLEERNMYDRDRRRIDSWRPLRDSIRRRDGRCEANLEDGEVESKQTLLPEKGSMERHVKGREPGRLTDKQLVSSYRKGRIDSEPAVNDSMSEAHKERLFAEISIHVKNVSVKDAQKSFVGVCSQLKKALRGLRDLNEDSTQANGKYGESQQRKMVALTRDTFSGIRAAYAVRSTAIGKEQEQDTNAFPRLLELARSRCKSLFTLKQIQELESMMQAIGCRSRDDGIPKTHTNALASQQTEKSEERDLKIGDSSGNTSVTTQLESDSTTENSANTRAEVGDEAEQPLNISVDLNLDGTSMEETVADSNIEGSLGLGGWFSYSPEQGDTQRCDDAKEERSHPTPSSSKIINSNENHNNSTLFSEGSCVEDKSNVLGSYDKRNASICKDSAFVSNFDPVKALTYYCERFAAKSQNLDTRLPSPTPSNEVVVENSLSEVSSTAGTNDHENKQSGKEDQVEFSKGTQPYLSVKDDASRGLASELALFPGSDAQTVEDGNTAGAQVKVVPMKGQKKSRDPRRRLDSQTIDLELPQVDTGGDEGLGPISVKQPTLQASQESLPLKDEFVSLLTFATGGWPSDAQARVLDKSSVADAVSQMLVDISSSLDDSSQRKRQVDFPIEESSGKRPRTAVILKEADVANLKASLAMEAFATRGDSKKGPLNESISSQLGLLKPKLASVMESMVNDLSKPRMKPRDPRRALLNSIVEKSKVPASGVAKGDASSSTALGAEAMTQMNREAIAGSVSQPAAFRSTIDKPDSMSNGAKGGTFSSEKTLGISSASVISQASGVVRNENHPSASSGGVLNDPMLISSNGRADDQSKMVKNSVVENKASVSKLLGRFDLNVSAVGNFKQRESMNHWDLEPLLEGLDEKQKQAVRQERARRIEEQSRMFVAKKLCLVLDLDHTLLNSAKFTEIEEEWETKLQANELTERSKFSKEGSNRRELYRFQHMGMWTKLRPGIWNFLARASHLYELHVYTMGNKAYATEMAKLLDPTGTLFAGRVISKGDDGDIVDGDERPPKSKDLDGVLGMESAVVIIDDSARVWPHHRHNLIVVERYMYFPCSRKQFGLPGPSLLEVGHDEREQDGMLASALAVIEKIHYNFFSNPRLHEVDVRDILAMEQRRVLSGCKLVFSRVFPQGEIQPHLHPLWQLAEQFGAACSMVIDEGVTHVVAISLGTEKVNWALATGRFVVRPSWVEASAILYRRANERDFLVTA